MLSEAEPYLSIICDKSWHTNKKLPLYHLAIAGPSIIADILGKNATSSNINLTIGFVLPALAGATHNSASGSFVFLYFTFFYYVC